MKQLNVLKENVAHHFVEMHRLSPSDPNRAATLKKQIVEESEKIDHLKKEILRLDHEIDLLADETRCAEIKDQLISQIKKEFPHAAEELYQYDTRLQEAQIRLKDAAQQKELLEPLLLALQSGQEIDLKNNLFKMLKGKNPKALLARIIHHALRIAEHIYPQAKGEPIQAFLDKFIKEAGDPSNHSLYRGHFPLFYRQLHRLIGDLEEEMVRLKNTIALQEQSIEKWLDTYTRTAL